MKTKIILLKSKAAMIEQRRYFKFKTKRSRKRGLYFSWYSTCLTHMKSGVDLQHSISWNWCYMANPATQEVEARGSEIQEYHRLQSKFKVCLGYMRPCTQKSKNKTTSAMVQRQLWIYMNTIISKTVIKKIEPPWSNFTDVLH